MLDATDALSGIVISEAAVSSLLRETDAAVRRGAEVRTPIELAGSACDEGDSFAARGLHGEAAERYARAWETLVGVDASAGGAGGKLQMDCAALRKRARIGDARSRCLLGRGHEMLVPLRELGDAFPDDVEILAMLAAAEAQSVGRGEGDRRTARSVMSLVLRLVPDSAALLHFVGDAALAIDDHEFAMLFFRRALAVDPARPTPRVAIARMLRRRGETLAAQLELVAALATLPGMREARGELARVHVLRGRPAEAVSILTGLLAEDPTDVESLVLLGEALLTLERTADARIALSHARRYDPDNSRALLIEGKILAALGRVREARERWTRLVEVGGDIADVTQAREALSTNIARWQDTPFGGMALSRGAA
jgi:Flp pilus assembly protein TadD